MIEIFCTECGNKIPVQEGKQFCFCTNCGNRIEIAPLKQETSIENPDNGSGQQQANVERAGRTKDVYLEEKLKEVEFYYQLSFDKREYTYTEKDPVYYLKAQDLLEELKDNYSSDYRVWWKLSKPLDFLCEEFTIECINLPPLNETHFQKALDVAKIEQKMELIERHDKYLERKKPYLERYQQQEQAETEKRQQEEKIRAEKEAEEREQIETEKTIEQNKKEKDLEGLNLSLWNDLSMKQYDKIDGGYFTYTESTGDEVTITMRNISNILYLTGYKKLAKNKITYNMQALAVKADDKGNIVGFNNIPIVIIDKHMNVNIKHLDENQLAVNGIPLTVDTKYVDTLARAAKKSLLKSKIFK